MSNQDLEILLDSINKNIHDEEEDEEEDGETLVTLRTDDVKDETETFEVIDDSKYFVDQDGNYYYQTDDDTIEVDSKTIKNTKKGNIKKKKENDETVYEINEKELINNNQNEGTEFVIPKKIVVLEKEKKSNENTEPLHTCTICNYSTPKRFILSRHIKAHCDVRPYKCSVCERGFKTNASLMNHVNTHLGKKPHPCDSCEMRFTTSGELSRHNRYRHTGEKPHKCTECDYASVELSKLRRHMRCHTGERPYQCPHCTYASPDTFKLKRHLRTHTGEKPYECDICHARFTQSNSLKAHRLIHSVGDKPIFQCNLCPTTCGRKTDLRLHMQKLHHSDHPITCKRCGKDLPDRYSYKVHIKTHEGEKSYRCQICPYASTSLPHLETHMLIHTDEKPYVCEHCQKTFRQQQLLKRHINLYHNRNYVAPIPREKNHTCPHCQRAFTHKGSLIRHMEIHDPLSNSYDEKLKLKMGRYARVQPDGTIYNIALMKKSSKLTNSNTIDEYLIDALDTTTTTETTTELSYEIINDDENDPRNDDNDNADGIDNVDNIDDDDIENIMDMVDESDDVDAPKKKSNNFLDEIDDDDHLDHGENDGENMNEIDDIDDEYIDDVENKCLQIIKSDRKKMSAHGNIRTYTSELIKQEQSQDKEFMSVKVSDGQDYMLVEVISCVDDDDIDDGNCVTIESTAEHLDDEIDALDKTKIEIENSFGFEEIIEDDCIYDSKGNIQLLDVVDT